MRREKKILQRALSGVLAAAMLGLTAMAASGENQGLSNFQKVNEYTAETFADISADAWYAESVQTAYELGLVKGSSDTTFSPDGNITVGAVLALACRLHSIYATGEGNFTQGTPWYAVYVDYALENGIIVRGQFDSYNGNATRKEFAQVLAKALPEEALEQFNTVEDGMIPDVPLGAPGYEEIYALYRSGILTGNDAAGTFAPDSTIGRSSVAAIVSRMAVPALRRSVTLKATPVTGVTLSQTSLTMEEGTSQTLTATVSPDNATVKAVIWSSSDSAVATVSGGVVTARSAGKAVITCVAASGVKAECAVTVTQKPVPATGITLSQTSATMDAGDTLQLTATVMPANSTEKNVTWYVENLGGMISVSNNGLVTASAPGLATVIAKVGAYEARCAVEVKKQGVKILLQNTLPMTLNEYDYHDNIESSWSVTDFRYETKEHYDGTYTAELYFSGSKTYDEKGPGQGATCKISWQLYDLEGYVVDSDTCYSPSVRVGEKFRDAHDYIFDLKPGTYKLELHNTN